jgi:hypothetical protein
MLANAEAARGGAGVARFTDVGEIAVRGKARAVQALAVEAVAEAAARGP